MPRVGSHSEIGQTVGERGMKPLSLGECCSQEQLMSLLDGQLGQHDSGLALSHIEQCVGCRKLLEDLSGDVRDWKEAREILSSSRDFGPKPPDDWSQSLSKRLLSPSSHPEMLGRIGRYDIESMLGVGDDARYTSLHVSRAIAR
jgi:serine/threonine-protein kinase